MILSSNKEEIISIATGLGFRLDNDQFDVDGKNWMRFELKEDLDEANLRWIWYRFEDFDVNLRSGANILFKAGQKAFKQRLNEYIEL